MSMRTYEKTLKISKRNHLFKSDIPLILNSSINTRTIMLLYTSIASITRRKEKTLHRALNCQNLASFPIVVVCRI